MYFYWGNSGYISITQNKHSESSVYTLILEDPIINLGSSKNDSFFKG